MKAEVYLIDDNGKRMQSIPTIIEPVETIDNGISTKRIFAFEIAKLNKDAFERLADEVQK